MILKINKLKNFGIFKNFSWNGLDNFSKKNIIYGWNYSGKTTLSKLFQSLEYKDKYRLFPSSEFEISTDLTGVSNKFTQNELEKFPYYVKVFNIKYIKDVFISDDMDLDIKPISFYLGDPSGQLVKKINEFENKKNELADIKENRYQLVIDDFSKYDRKTGVSKFSEKAKEIRENYLDGKLTRDDFNISHLRKKAETIKSDLLQYILTDSEKIKVKAEAISENRYDPLKDNFELSENLEKIWEDVKTVLGGYDEPTG